MEKPTSDKINISEILKNLDNTDDLNGSHCSDHRFIDCGELEARERKILDDFQGSEAS